MSLYEDATEMLREIHLEVASVKKAIKNNREIIKQQSHLLNQQSQQIQLLQQQNEKIMERLSNNSNRPQQNHRRPFRESHVRDISPPRNPQKKKKDGSFYQRGPNQPDYKEALKIIMDKDNVDMDLVFFNDMANSVCAEIMLLNDDFITTDWSKLPRHTKQWAINEFEERLAKAPYNMKVNRAKGHWMTTIIVQRWENRQKNKDKWLAGNGGGFFLALFLSFFFF